MSEATIRLQTKLKNAEVAYATIYGPIHRLDLSSAEFKEVCAALSAHAEPFNFNAGEGAVPSPLAAASFPTPSASGRSQPAPEPSGWMPIETAPKDGYAAVAVPVYWSVTGKFSHWDVWSADLSSDHYQEDANSGWRIKDARLWLALPAPPARAEPSGAETGEKHK